RHQEPPKSEPPVPLPQETDRLAPKPENMAFQVKPNESQTPAGTQEEATQQTPEFGAVLPSTSVLSSLKRRIHTRFLKDADIAAVSRLTREELSKQIRDLAASVVAAEGLVLTQSLRLALVDAVISEILGLGPLEPLLADPDITEIMVNSADRIYVE